jgi:hypothetical protein
MRNLSPDSSRAPPEQKSRALPTDQPVRCSVFRRSLTIIRVHSEYHTKRVRGKMQLLNADAGGAVTTLL